MRSYPSLEEATADALDLAEGMTYKNALAGLPLGGGKSVLLADRDLDAGREELFLWFGACVESLGGRYVTAEDMGTRVDDIEVVRRVTAHVAGRDPEQGGGGDPSPWTALGVFNSMRACLERVYGTKDFTGETVAIQGVGHVGRFLARHLAEAGATLILSDTRAKNLDDACREFDARAVEVDDIFSVECDIFSPCAISHVLTRQNISKLRCKIIAGAANIQLADADAEAQIAGRGILYAPDFAINSGGVILCADERDVGGFTEERVRERVLSIYQTTKRVFDEAQSRGVLPGEAALLLAKERIRQASSKPTTVA
jgi:leucine dehydrogenase